MSSSEKQKEPRSVEVFKDGDFGRWLSKNGAKENHVLVILHKKHTGKMHTNAAGLMREAICYGWIDTTSKRIDEDRWAINYRKRTKNSRWSYNTLRYGEELIKEGKMKPAGLKAFEEGKKKKPHDFGLPENPDMPEELSSELAKSKKAKENFEKFSPSMKRTYYRWILRGKQEETRKKRAKAAAKLALENVKVGASLKANN